MTLAVMCLASLCGPSDPLTGPTACSFGVAEVTGGAVGAPTTVVTLDENTAKTLAIVWGTSVRGNPTWSVVEGAGAGAGALTVDPMDPTRVTYRGVRLGTFHLRAGLDTRTECARTVEVRVRAAGCDWPITDLGSGLGDVARWSSDGRGPAFGQSCGAPMTPLTDSRAFLWTAPSSGEFRFFATDSPSSSQSPTIAVHDAVCGTSTRCRNYFLQFNATEGQRVYLVVTRNSQASGPLEHRLQILGCPDRSLGSRVNFEDELRAPGDLSGVSATCNGEVRQGPATFFGWVAPFAGRFTFRQRRPATPDPTGPSRFILTALDGGCTETSLGCAVSPPLGDAELTLDLREGQRVTLVAGSNSGLRYWPFRIGISSCPEADLGSAIGYLIVPAELASLPSPQPDLTACGGSIRGGHFLRWTAPATATYDIRWNGTEGVAVRSDCRGMELTCASNNVLNAERGQSVVFQTNSNAFSITQCPTADLGGRLGRALARNESVAEPYRHACSATVGGAPVRRTGAVYRWTAPRAGTFVFYREQAVTGDGTETYDEEGIFLLPQGCVAQACPSAPTPRNRLNQRLEAGGATHIFLTLRAPGGAYPTLGVGACPDESFADSPAVLASGFASTTAESPLDIDGVVCGDVEVRGRVRQVSFIPGQTRRYRVEVRSVVGALHHNLAQRGDCQSRGTFRCAGGRLSSPSLELDATAGSPVLLSVYQDGSGDGAFSLHVTALSTTADAGMDASLDVADVRDVPDAPDARPDIVDAPDAADVPSDACTTTSPSRCGAVCCAAGQACVLGACLPRCAGALPPCAAGAMCVSLANVCVPPCGAGRPPCPGGLVCMSGTFCSSPLPCPPPSTTCAMSCVNPLADSLHCGGCGAACPAGQVCLGGVCGAPCPSGQSRCSGACVDTQTSAAHCGSCGRTVTAGQTCCAGNPVATGTDARHCGGCGRACASGQTCVAGACQTSSICYPGETLCGATCANLTTASAHCGRCGNACPLNQGCAAGVCAGGSCPSPRYATCPIGDASFYCANTAADPRNCGRCGNACPAGMLCARTAPGTPPSCQSVGGFCTGAALLACGEFCRDHLNDVAHCGGCDVRCAAGERCVGGACGTPPP